jgi:hypothetical protein
MSVEPAVSVLLLAVPGFLANGRDLEFIGFVIGIIFWIQMMRFCLTREAGMTKILWLIFMIVLPPLGSVLYFFLRVAVRREFR